jgi:hypothetical protein
VLCLTIICAGCGSQRGHPPALPVVPEIIEVEKPRPSPCPLTIPEFEPRIGMTSDGLDAAWQAYALELRRHLKCWITGAPPAS